MLGSFGLREGVKAQGFVPDRLCREAVGSVVVVQLLSVLVNLTACPSPTFLGEGSLPPRFVCPCPVGVPLPWGGHTTHAGRCRCGPGLRGPGPPLGPPPALAASWEGVLGVFCTDPGLEEMGLSPAADRGGHGEAWNLFLMQQLLSRQVKNTACTVVFLPTR